MIARDLSVAEGDLRPYFPRASQRRAAAQRLDSRARYALTCSRIAYPDDCAQLDLDYKAELARLAEALGATPEQIAEAATIADEVARAFVDGDMARARPHMRAHRRVGWSGYADLFVGVYREQLAVALNPEITEAARRRCWH